MSTDRAGLTLIELLVVTLVIGVLALLAAPRLEQARAAAHMAAVRTDLEYLGRQAQMHRIQYGTYVGVDSLVQRSPGVTITFEWLKAAGLLAKGEHRVVQARVCWYLTGRVPEEYVAPPGVAPDRVVCTEE